VTAFSAALVFLWLYLRLRFLSSGVRLGALLFLSAMLYVIAGGALAVFSLLVAAVELHSRSRWPMVLLPLLVGGVVPLAAGWSIFDLSLAEAWRGMLPIAEDDSLVARRGASLLAALYAVLPATGFGVLLWRGACRQWFLRITRGRAPQVTSRSPGGEGAIRPASGAVLATRAGEYVSRLLTVLQPTTRGTWIVQTACLLIATISILAGTHDRKLKGRLAVDYYACHKMWARVLEAARDNPEDVYVQSAVGQALFHTGRLNRELPVVRKPGDLLLFDEKELGHWRKSDLYFDLGYVNMALHHLTEAMEFWGERPLLLQRLALVNLALGNGSTARIYLQALTRVPFHSRWAKEYLRRFQSEPALTSDPEVGRLRTLMAKKDVVLRLPVDYVLLLLLDGNRHNRMAFEYLMTYFLLTKNLTGFIDNLSRADDFAGFDITPLWDEALALATKHLGLHPNLKSRQSSAEAQRRLEHVLQVIAGCGGNRETARGKLQDEYGNSYFFYYFFHS
jgi:tetratricopeptide (TPR) repeat protein